MLFLFSKTKYEEAKKAIAAKGKQLQQKVSWNTAANCISTTLYNGMPMPVFKKLIVTLMEVI